MNRLTTDERTKVLGMMVEGMAIRAIVRLTGISKNTIVKLLEDAGSVFAAYQDQTLRNLNSRRIQVDEIWSFCAAKQKNIPNMKSQVAGAGDIWTWTAIDADTKLAVSWLVGGRDGSYAREFMLDVAGRLKNRVQLTSDGHAAYLDAVDQAFGIDVDYAMLVKIYGAAPEGQDASRRYSPAECVDAKPTPITGNPDPLHISTSYVERSNLTLRMHSRRFTRLTNAFSKKAINHAHAVALNFMYYNFVRIHGTLRMTPAMAAGVTTRLWEIRDMAVLLEQYEKPPKPRGPYKKRAYAPLPSVP